MTRGLGYLLALAFAYTGLCLCLVLGSVLFSTPCTEVARNYDVAVVLGGGMEGSESVQAAETGRVHAAIRLFERGKAARLYLTGGGDKPLGSNAEMMAGVALDLGVPASAIRRESQSLSTLQNALFADRDLPRQVRVIVVTERFHAWRASAAFAWSGRPADVCTSPVAARPGAQQAAALLREVAAWGFNIPRAVIWSAAGWLGLDRMMPQVLLA